MAAMPDPSNPGWGEDLAWLDRDPEREHWLDRAREYDEPGPEEEEEYWKHDELTAEELAEIVQAAADEVLAVEAAATGRRGPGLPGSARVFAGESASTAAGFGTGMALDVTPGGPGLAVAADAAVGGADEDCFDGVADHELIGLLCAWDRLEAHMAARKLAVAAELFRRNPEDGFEPSPGAMPEVVSEFAADQLACALAESRSHADGMLTMAWHLATRLTGTMAALRDGVITRHKAEIIVRATVTLEPEEARKAEAKVLDRAGRLTPGGLRAAIARAVMEVAPEKGQEAAGGSQEGHPGRAVAGGLWQCRARGLRTPPGRGPGGGPTDHLVGTRTEEGGPGGRHGRAARPRLPRLGARQGLAPHGQRGRRGRPGHDGRVRRPGDLDRAAGYLAGPGRPARREPRYRAHRPVASSRPG
jgi:hypothetical protein